MVKKITLAFVALLFAGVICFADDAVVASVEKVNTANKTIAVKTADGAKETFVYTDTTTVTGAKDVASTSDLAGKSGYHFVIRYTKVGKDKVATGLEYSGQGSWKATKGTVVAVDDSAKTVSIKTAKGTVETYHVSEDCTVDAGKGIGKAGSATGESVATGSEVTVHYTEEGGKKVAHFFKKSF